jgi:hypothetical protein
VTFYWKVSEGKRKQLRSWNVGRTYYLYWHVHFEELLISDSKIELISKRKVCTKGTFLGSTGIWIHGLTFARQELTAWAILLVLQKEFFKKDNKKMKSTRFLKISMVRL